MVLRRNSGCKIINRIVRQLLPEASPLERLARLHNLRQRGACLARPNPQRSPLNRGSVVALVLLDPLVPPLEQDSVPSASSNSNYSSSLRGLGLALLAKLSHNHRPALALAVSVPHNRSNNPAVPSVISIQSPLRTHLVQVFRFNLALSTDTLKVLQLRAQALSVPVPELSVSLSPRPLPSALHLNSPRLVHSALEDMVPVSTNKRQLYLSLLSSFRRNQAALWTNYHGGLRY